MAWRIGGEGADGNGGCLGGESSLGRKKEVMRVTPAFGMLTELIIPGSSHLGA